jgi:hypothetical protein
MNIEHISLTLSGPVRPHTAAALSALLLDEPLPRHDDFVTAELVTAVAPSTVKPIPPAIGERWPGIQGIYAGLARGMDGEPDGHLVLLDARPDDKLDHADATAWADDLGDGARLPTRFESALLYANLRDRIDTAGWYWTSTLFSVGTAWYQYFNFGYQNVYDTDYAGRAVAVRRLTA